MQVLPPARPMPIPLTCSGCRHWGAAIAAANSEVATLGRCDRFAEARPGTARPRCNICWEPASAVPPIQDGRANEGFPIG